MSKAKTKLIHNVLDAIMIEGPEDTIPETFLEVIGKETREVYLSKLIAYTLAHDYALIEKLISSYLSVFYNDKKTDRIEINNPEINIEKYMDGRRADIFVIIRSGKKSSIL